MTRKKKIILGISALSLVSLVYLYFSSRSSPTPLPPPTFESEIPVFSQEGLRQTQNDFQFNEIVKTEVTKLPFLTSLPIVTNNYIILYDFESQLIRVDLSPSVSQVQVETEVKTKLTQIGVDLKKIPLKFAPALSSE